MAESTNHTGAGRAQVPWRDELRHTHDMGSAVEPTPRPVALPAPRPCSERS